MRDKPRLDAKSIFIIVYIIFNIVPASAQAVDNTYDLVRLDDYLNELRDSLIRLSKDVDDKAVQFELSPINIEIQTTSALDASGAVELYVVTIGTDVNVGAINKMSFTITPSIKVVENFSDNASNFSFSKSDALRAVPEHPSAALALEDIDTPLAYVPRRNAELKNRYGIVSEAAIESLSVQIEELEEAIRGLEEQ